MALSDFFRINLPYGIRVSSTGEWTAFNREYLPLGFDNATEPGKHPFGKYPVRTKYKKLSKAFLIKLAGDVKYIDRDDKGNIYRVYLYDDTTNPADNPIFWNVYFYKIKLLAGLKRDMGVVG